MNHHATDAATRPRAALQIVGVVDAAQRLAVHPNTIRNWAKTGLLPSHRKPGSGFLCFALSDIETLETEMGITPSPTLAGIERKLDRIMAHLGIAQEDSGGPRA